MTIRDTLISTRDWFKSLEATESEFKVSASTINFFTEEIEKLTSKISQTTNRLKELEEAIKKQFSDMKKIGYKIHSVFVHRGQATFGHYWIYINDMKDGIFRKYNDEYVTEVPYTEVFDDNEENTATPYFLVFVREDLANEYTDAVVRQPLQSPSPSPVQEGQQHIDEKMET